MARKQFLKRYILDDNGFILNQDGDMLQTYFNKEGDIFSIVEGQYYFFKNLIKGYEKPNFRYIKFLKRVGLWKTYVKSNAVNIDGNKAFKEELKAALHANRLIGEHGLDRIPNAVPKPNDELQYKDIKTKFFNVFLAGSIKCSYLHDNVRADIDYYLEHPELKHRLRFLVGDNPKGADRHFQQYLYELGLGDQVIVCHMDEEPRNLESYDFSTYEVDVPVDEPYTSSVEFQSFKDRFMSNMCQEAIVVVKGNDANTLATVDSIKDMGKPLIVFGDNRA